MTSPEMAQIKHYVSYHAYSLAKSVNIVSASLTIASATAIVAASYFGFPVSTKGIVACSVSSALFWYSGKAANYLAQQVRLTASALGTPSTHSPSYHPPPIVCVSQAG